MNQKKLNELKIKALDQKIPILSDDGLLFLINTLKEKKATSVLEIGSAIGYSAIAMALLANVKVVTIEKDSIRYQQAVENIKAFNLTEQIEIIEADALTLELKQATFDAIFIDAAKAQYEKFFNKYEALLSDSGFIITDNLNFHNLDINVVSRSTRNLIKRLEAFKAFLNTNPNYQTTITNIGDGMSVSERRHHEKVNHNI